MRKAMLLASLFVLTATAALADNQPVFVVYGSDFMVSVNLPSRWNVDLAFAKSHGINGFFYLKDFGLEHSPAGIILELAKKRSPTDKLSNFIAWDQQNLRRNMPSLKIRPFSKPPKSKQNYLVRSYEYSQAGDFIQVDSYLDTGKSYFVNFYVSFRTQQDADKYLPDYLGALKALRFVPISVKKQ